MAYFEVEKKDGYLILTTQDSSMLNALLSELHNKQGVNLPCARIETQLNEDGFSFKYHLYLPIALLDWFIWFDLETIDRGRSSYFEPSFIGTYDHFKLEVNMTLRLYKVKDDPYFYQSNDWYFAETEGYKISYKIETQEYIVHAVGSADLVYETDKDLDTALKQVLIASQV